MKFLRKTAMWVLVMGMGFSLLSATSGCDELEEATAWTLFEQNHHLGNGPSPFDFFESLMRFL